MRTALAEGWKWSGGRLDRDEKAEGGKLSNLAKQEKGHSFEWSLWKKTV